MSEYITIQGNRLTAEFDFVNAPFIAVGQCGNQIGNEFWPLVLQEYGIATNYEHNTNLKDRDSKFDSSSYLNSFFHIPESSKLGKHKTISDLVTNKIKARVSALSYTFDI